MTNGIGSSVADVARALAAAKQANQSSASDASAPPRAATGRTGNEGDSVTLSAEAQKSFKLDGSVTPIDMSKVRLVTPQGLRGDAEAGLQKVMADLGIEGDLEFAISVNDDGSIAVQSDDPQAEALEQAINGDPALQKTLREMEMFSGHSVTMPAMKEAFDWRREHEDEVAPPGLFDALDAARERSENSSYTVIMIGGTLTTAFVDPDGERFGGIGTDTGLDGRWT